MASNGINDLGRFDFVSDGMYPGSQIDHSYYANATQMPLGAQAVQADYDPETNPLTGEPVSHFAKGGIATLHFDGTEGSQIRNPEQAQDPYVESQDPTLPPNWLRPEDYTSSGFAAPYSQEQANSIVDPNNIRQGYGGASYAGLQGKSNYFDPTSAGEYLIDPKTNRFLKDQSGNLIPVPKPDPNAGKFGDFMADTVIPVGIAAGAAMTGAGAAGLIGEGAALGSAAAPTTTGGITSLTPEMSAAINSAAAPTYGSATLPYGITSVAPEVSSTMIPGAAALEAGAGAGAGTAGMTAKEALSAYAALNMLKSGLGGGQTATSGQGAPSTTTTTAPHAATPAMFNMPTTTLGSAYTPYTYAYNPRDFGIRAFAQGGPAFETGGIASLGSYSDGGQLLKGPGDGMSDDIPASIGQDQPARLADGEFVIPADVVSHLGNGSTDAGAKHLYKMMDRIRQARTGNHKQGKKINPEKFLPKG